MFAVVKTGGKQYRVSPGDVIVVEKLLGDSGDNITLSEVLMIGDDTTTTVGSPFIQGSVVEATIREQDRADKIIVFKKKRRQGYRRKKGHRQDVTVLTINAIGAAGSLAPVVSAKKVAKPVVEQLPQAMISDVANHSDVDHVQAVQPVVKRAAVRKPKVAVDTSVVSTAETVDSQDQVIVTKPKKATTKVKKEPEA